MSKNVQNKASLARIPKIIRGIKDGKTYEMIAEECGVNEKTIRRDRASIPFRDFFNDLADEYISDLAKLREYGDSKDRRFALSQKGQFLRAMTRAIIPTKIEAKITGDVPLSVVFHSSLKSLEPEEEETENDQNS